MLLGKDRTDASRVHPEQHEALRYINPRRACGRDEIGHPDACEALRTLNRQGVNQERSRRHTGEAVFHQTFWRMRFQ